MDNNHYQNERSDFYKTFSEMSKTEHVLVTIPLIRALENNLGGLNNKFGLNYGCGNGFVTSLIHQRGTTIIGVDNSVDQITKAQQREQEGLRFIHIKENDIGIVQDNSLDFSYFRFSTCEMSDEVLEIIFKRVWQKMKEGGVIAIGDQNRERCLGHETMDVYYPHKDTLFEGEATTTILKKHGIKFIGNENKLIENIDFIPIIDHFRSKVYIKNMLEKTGFLGVKFKEMRLRKNSQVSCFDEKEIPMYKITTAKK